MTPIRSSKLSPSVESLRSFRPRPTETSSGSATSHSIVNAIGRALLQSAQALPRHRHTLRQACEKFPRRGAVGCRYNPPQLNTGPSVGHGVSLLCWRSGGVEHPHDTPPYPFMPSPTSAHSSRPPLIGKTWNVPMGHRGSVLTPGDLS